MVHRRQFRPRPTLRRWRAKKRGPDDEPEDHALGRSRGGWGSKLHIICDSHGIPITVTITAGQRHESMVVTELFDAAHVPRPGPGRPRKRPKRAAGDKGYSYPRVRAALRDRHIQPVIPTRSNQRRQPNFDRETYRKRCIVEQVIGWLKEARRIATRFEKLAVNFLAMIKLAMIRRYLRILN